VCGALGPGAPTGHTGGVEHAFLDAPRPLAFAHRGGWSYDTAGRRTDLENTAVAFQHAVDLGYRYLETDVHATRDGVAMAFHDATLDRATDRSGAIAALPYAEVARARVGGGEPVPLLEDLLGTWPQARFNLDVKDRRAVEPLARVLRRTRAWDRVCVGSFGQARLEAARRVLDRPVCMSAGPLDVARLRLAALRPAGWDLGALVRRGVACVQVPLAHRGLPVLTRAFIAEAHRHGMQVHVWTINEPSTMARLLDAGVDGLFTDDTSALRRLLIARGTWQGTARPQEPENSP
jgi:glycerophosphoryl diester phosphodiesterase